MVVAQKGPFLSHAFQKRTFLGLMRFRTIPPHQKGIWRVHAQLTWGAFSLKRPGSWSAFPWSRHGLRPALVRAVSHARRRGA
jgi:hypothetical protein